MAITVGTVTSSAINVNGSTKSFNYTPAVAPDLVVVIISWQESVGGVTLLSITYGGAAMTFRGSQGISTGNVEIWTILSPASGLQAILTTWDTTSLYGGVVGAVAFNGTAVSPIGTIATSTGGTTAASVTVTPIQASSFVIAGMGVDLTIDNTITATIGSGETSRWNVTGGIVASNNRTLGTCSTQASGGNGVMDWTLSVAKTWGMIGMEVLAPSSSTNSRVTSLALMGVGG